MKKTATLFIMMLVAIATNAQQTIEGTPVRPYKPEETQRIISICEKIKATLPTTFKQYKAEITDCSNFDWAIKDEQGRSITAENKNKQAIGSNPGCNIVFSRDKDSVDAEVSQLMTGLNDVKKDDGTYDTDKFNAIAAKENKILACQNLSISVITNIQNDYALQYPKGMKPDTLKLPITAFTRFASFKYGNPIVDENGAMMDGTDVKDYYKDRAIIFISNKAPKTTVSIKAEGKMNWEEMKIIAGEAQPETLMSPLKSIVVIIKGDKQDVLAAIKTIDWKALQALLNK